jgi:hypothetical protein
LQHCLTGDVLERRYIHTLPLQSKVLSYFFLPALEAFSDAFFRSAPESSLGKALGEFRHRQTCCSPCSGSFRYLPRSANAYLLGNALANLSGEHALHTSTGRDGSDSAAKGNLVEVLSAVALGFIGSGSGLLVGYPRLLKGGKRSVVDTTLDCASAGGYAKTYGSSYT